MKQIIEDFLFNLNSLKSKFLKQHQNYERSAELGAISRLFVSDVVSVDYEYYKNECTSYEQITLQYIANEKIRYGSKMLGGKK